MILSFRHKGLERLLRNSDRRGLDARQTDRIDRMLDRLAAASHAADMNLPGYDFHGLKGDRKGTFAVSVSGNLWITFRFDGPDALDVNLEDYH